jgi:hypothetical protein
MKRNPQPNKSDFVRKHEGAPARAVVAMAKKHGIKLTERYVYVIRSSDKAKARRRGLVQVHGRGRGQTDERSLRHAIAEVGLARSRAILADVERALSA